MIRPRPPQDLSAPRLPVYSSKTWIDEHGFTARQIGPGWWNEALRKAGFDHQVTLPSRSGTDNSLMLLRSDLFSMGLATIGADFNEDAVLGFLWHVLAWGSGTSRRWNSQRIQAFAGRDESGVQQSGVRRT